MKLHIAYRTGKPWNPVGSSAPESIKDMGKGMCAHRVWIDGREVFNVTNLSTSETPDGSWARLTFALRAGELTNEGPEFAEDAAGPATTADAPGVREALQRLLDRHGAYIDELPGETGVSDLAFARAALDGSAPSPDWEAMARRMVLAVTAATAADSLDLHRHLRTALDARVEAVLRELMVAMGLNVDDDAAMAAFISKTLADAHAA